MKSLTIFCVWEISIESLLQGLYKLRFLILYISLVSVAYKVDILALLLVLPILHWVEGFLFFEVIELCSLVVLEVRVGILGWNVSDVLPVDPSEEWVLLDLINTLGSQSILCIAPKNNNKCNKLNATSSKTLLSNITTNYVKLVAFPL